MKCVVGTLFYDNGKVLLDKPRKRPTYQMVGGSLEENETPLDGAFREAREELGNKVNLDKNLFKFLFEFDEKATSDPSMTLHFYIFEYHGILEGELTTSEEIEDFIWYDTSLGENMLSYALKNEIIPLLVKDKKIN